jgi:hypothetical protein
MIMKEGRQEGRPVSASRAVCYALGRGGNQRLGGVIASKTRPHGECQVEGHGLIAQLAVGRRGGD